MTFVSEEELRRTALIVIEYYGMVGIEGDGRLTGGGGMGRWIGSICSESDRFVVNRFDL